MMQKVGHGRQSEGWESGGCADNRREVLAEVKHECQEEECAEEVQIEPPGYLGRGEGRWSGGEADSERTGGGKEAKVALFFGESAQPVVQGFL